MKSTITEKQDESLQRVVKMWAELGLPPAALNDRTAEIIGLVSEMWDHVVSQEEESLAKAIKYKDERYAQINEMLSALHLPPYVMPTDYSLFATGKLLLAKFDELKKVKDERMDKLSSLLEKRDRLCDSIGEKPEFLKLMTTIPAEHEIAELQSYVSKLQSDKNKRMNQFITIKSDIVNLMAELGLSANGKFEISAVSNDADQFILSKENIKKLVDWQQKLEKTNEANKAKKAAMIERLNYLWTKLEIDESECEDILQHYPINSQQVLDSLKTEQIDKYEAIRKERLGEFIEKLVPEVEHWWERCCVSEDDQNAFLEQIKDLPEASEERLDAWEKELADKKAFYSERQAAFEDVETWKSAWEEFLQIEIGEKDPARLNNRRIPSTVIMKEQQQKRKLEAQIKKHEKALSMLSDKYVNEGKPFLVGGLILKDFIHSKRTEYDEMKENEKQCKKLQKNALMAAEMQGLKTGSASKYVMPPARKTPVKRGGGNSGVTSPSSPSKLRRINGIGSNTKRPGPPGPSSKPSTITKPPRNLTSKFSKATLPLASQGPTGSQQSVLSVNEEEFQVSNAFRIPCSVLRAVFP